MDSYFLSPPTLAPIITDVRQQACNDSCYIKPYRLHYKQDGIEKNWDIIHSHDSVSIALYDVDVEAFVIVRQFRPAVFMHNTDGYIYELCAGLVDKPNKSLEEIAIEEVLEECGYRISVERLEKVITFFASVGMSGARQSVFFASVSQKDKYTKGGGIDDECIEVLYLKRASVFDFLHDDAYHKTPALGFVIYHLLHHGRI